VLPIKGYAPQRLLCKQIAAAWRLAVLANPGAENPRGSPRRRQA
jgi:hypothetical protein